MDADTDTTKPIEIDRHNLRVIRERFASIHASRWERAMAPLKSRQKMFLSCIPALLHLNTPTLPGYSRSKKIHGVENWDLEAATLKKLKALWPAFNPKPKRFNKPKSSLIRSVCVMGSIGSIAQSDDSDFDFWIIHNDTDEDEQPNLTKKLMAIEKFAKRLRLEIHFYSMTERNVREGNLGDLDNESSGHTQHKLLLDEFYRSHIHLAGSIPLWYLIPPDYECQYLSYAHTLLSRRFVNHAHVIDLGAVLPIPIHEYASSGMWHLFKGLKSPYKSLIKLALCRAYAAQLPDIEPLSSRFKRCIYQNQLNHHTLDPYLMMLNTIEHHLQICEREQDIDFIRMCAYYKLTNHSSSIHDPESWQHQTLKELLKQWQWSDQKIQELNHAKSSHQTYLTTQSDVIKQHLMEGHKAIMELHMAGDKWSPVMGQELEQIKAQLHAYFSVMPHKITTISIGLDNRVHSQLTVTQSSDAWSLNTLVDGTLNLLYQHRSLVNVLTWGIANRQISSANQILFNCAHHWLALDASQLLRYLIDIIQHKKPELTESSRPRLTRCALILNASKQPPIMHLDDATMYVEQISDPLCHGNNHECLIVETDLVSINDWGETFVESGREPTQLLSCLLSYLQYNVYESKRDSFSVQCFNGVYSQLLKARVKLLITGMAKWFRAHKRGRFLFEWGEKIAIIGRIDDQWSTTLQSLTQLELKNEDAHYCPFAVDPASHRLSPLKHVSAYGAPNSVTLLVAQDAKRKRVLWINDEKGHCRSFALSTDHWKDEINGYYQYVQNIQKHLNLQRHFQDVISEKEVFCFFYEVGDDQPQALMQSSTHFNESSIQLKRLPAIKHHHQYRITDGETPVPQILDHIEFKHFMDTVSPQRKIYVIDMFPDMKSPFKSTMQALLERHKWSEDLDQRHASPPIQ